MKTFFFLSLALPVFIVYFFVFKYVYNVLGIYSAAGDVISIFFILVILLPLALVTTRALIKGYNNSY